MILAALKEKLFPVFNFCFWEITYLRPTPLNPPLEGGRITTTADAVFQCVPPIFTGASQLIKPVLLSIYKYV